MTLQTAEQGDVSSAQVAAKTAFANFCKRYMTETNPDQALRKERYAKGRRRWARKDLVSFDYRAASIPSIRTGLLNVLFWHSGF